MDDIVEGVVRTADHIPTGNPNWSGDHPDPATSKAPYKIYNIGNNQPVELLYLIETLEKCLGKKAEKNFLPMQPGDVPATYADVDDLIRDVGFKPATPIETGRSARLAARQNTLSDRPMRMRKRQTKEVNRRERWEEEAGLKGAGC